MEIVFLASLQGYQTNRERDVASRLTADRPDLAVRFLSPEESAPLLAKCKLKFGPAVLINGRLEFVGIPRYRMLLERIEISKRRAAAPAPAPAPAPVPAVAAPTAAPAKPADSGG